MIKYVKEKGTISPVVDDNWHFIGFDFSKLDGREEMVQLINEDIISLPTEGRFGVSYKSINLLKKPEKKGKLHSVGVDSYARDTVLYILIFLFIILLIGVGRMKGLMALISLVITGLLIAFFMLPMMFKGYSPILLVIITATIVIFLSLMLIGGFNKKSLAAIIGTSAGVVIAGIISLISGRLAHLTGITGEARGLSGSIGLVLTVPITSIVSTLFIEDGMKKDLN